MAKTASWLRIHTNVGKLSGNFALIGTTMAPGFSNDDYQGGERAALLQQYPHEAALITRLTRPHAALSLPIDL